MLVPLSWLKDYVDINVTPDVLEEKLFSCGFEVEEKYQVGHEIDKVVVGLVKTCEDIEGTHLHLCTVDAGENGVLQICCGADNVKAGGKYPLALVGATVYATAKDHKTVEGLMTIGAGKLRGYDSFGMLCSGVEIGVTEDMFPGAGYNGLLVLPDDCTPGADIKPVLGLDDWIFDVSITANRPDCQSIFGIAREVAAVLELPLKAPATDYHESGETINFNVKVDAQDLCPRYIAHYVSDVKIAESPAWMKRRLALVGCSAISNVVDITNYVLKEIGQPMHAFDFSYLEGNAINVRRANDGEKIVTLDEKEFALKNDNLVICDGKKPVALAGIMGGLNSEILDTTGAVMFESAKFAHDNIRKSSKALGQVSDSSARFSKGVDEYSTVMAMKRALHLIEELGCGKVSSTHFDINSGNSVEPFKLVVSVKKVNGVLGITVPDADIIRICKNLDFAPVLNGDELTLMIPAYRTDMATYQDVAEEVIRMYGYEHIIPTFIPTAEVTSGGYNLRQKSELKIRRALCAGGAFEGVHYSFFSPSDLDLLRLPADAPERHAIKLINPINIDLSLMRTTLVPQMLTAIAKNQKKGILEGRIYELGNKFIPKELPLTEYPDERETICIGVFGEKENFFTLKGLVDIIADALDVSFDYEASQNTFLHPYRTATVICNGEKVGFLGQLLYEIQDEMDMRVPAYVAEIDLKALSKYYGKDRHFIPLPKFLEEKRDFCFVMDKDVTCAAVEKSIKESCEYITSIELFDIYEGAQLGNKKSLAFSVVFTPKNEEFTPAMIDGFVEKILADLEAKYGVTLRA